MCINEDFGKIWRKDMPAAKGSVPDVRGEIRQQALYFLPDVEIIMTLIVVLLEYIAQADGVSVYLL